jgi:LPXTG-motif cell wall-anchored protein
VIPTNIEGVYIRDSLGTVAEEVSGIKQETTRKLYEAYLADYLKDEDGNPIAQDNLVVSQVNGKLAILGLEAGTYYLKEVEAPDGYNALTQPIALTAGEDIRPFTIFADKDGKVADIQQTDGVHNEINYDLTHTVVHNSKGVVLPSTGGEGTFWLITIGTMMAIGFAVFLITHKKMSIYTD